MAILSCHDEFKYAHQALQLQVREYILKDALDIDEINRLLHQFKEALDVERFQKESEENDKCN
ncbi:hypothetical protein ACI2OX_01820 [Bacillus sp. N9]